MTGLETTPDSILDHNPASKQGWRRSFGAILEHLFIREKDAPAVLLMLGLITLIGFVLRIILINKAIAYDEAYTLIQFASRSYKVILADYSAPNNHILHTILVGILYRLFGGQPWVLRLPAFTAGVLLIPAMYITARRFFTAPQALGASGLIAVIPLFINYSVNGRGYTMIVLFALLLANFGAVLVSQQSRSALIAYGLTAALGFYTIPIFLYPMAGISLWVVLTYLFAKESWQGRLRKLAVFLGVCLAAGVLTLILYSPVIVFGTGLSSITSNDIVKSLDWSAFLENLDPRLKKTSSKLMAGVSQQIEYVFMAGFLISLFFYRKVSNQKLPLQVFLVLAIVILLSIQRVTPVPRVWIYLQTFYLMFAAAGLVWLAGLLVYRAAEPQLMEKVLSVSVLLLFIGVFINILIARQNDPVEQDRDLLPEAYAADYLAEHLKPEDTLVATGPVDITTGYYLSLHGVPYDRFYHRDHPVEIQNALVLIRKSSKYKTPESVVQFFRLDQALDMNAAELVFEYANVQIYSVPAR
jgi:4-amino-4-deoxy-L-arabinose transferase-like glycosyltransferase